MTGINPQTNRQDAQVPKRFDNSARDRRENKTEPILNVTTKRSTGRESPNPASQKTGNPIHDLEDRTRDELFKMAAEHKIPSRDEMTKEELVAALQDYVR